VPRRGAGPCATPATYCACALRCTVLGFHAADSRAAEAACTSRMSTTCTEAVCYEPHTPMLLLADDHVVFAALCNVPAVPQHLLPCS
jgi:hypothetical protein